MAGEQLINSRSLLVAGTVAVGLLAVTSMLRSPPRTRTRSCTRAAS